jgi:hypothetical protein
MGGAYVARLAFAIFVPSDLASATKERRHAKTVNVCAAHDFPHLARRKHYQPQRTASGVNPFFRFW